MIFQNSWVLLFLILLPFLVYIRKKKVSYASIRFSSIDFIRGGKPTLKIKFSENLIYIRVLVLAFFIIALARPRVALEEVPIASEGIDIILAIDSSSSMLAEDFTFGSKRRNRLYVVKKVVRDFIKGRTGDRIGVVTFAKRAYTVCPLTLDYDWLVRNIERIEIGAIEDGTAIGSAISSSLVRLKDTKAKSKIVILLTDGVNNSGKISPVEAAQAAQALGVKIYTIGAGTKGLVPFPVQDVFGRSGYTRVQIDIDEDTLREIARISNGKYFRATDTESLKSIYNEIDRLEKTTTQESGYREYKEMFHYFLLIGLSLLLLEVLLDNTYLRKLP